MQRDLVIKGRSLGGSSDLTLLAKIKPGFVDSIESVTYKTRIKRVLESLHGARMVSHEQHEARLLSDSIERVAMIQSVRVAVLEPEDKVLLAVTFDGSWQSYIRVLWDKVGTLLDLIFCGTVDYVTADGHSFDEWLEWAYGVQVETGFFYGAPEFTARDVFYQRRIERMRLRGPKPGSAAPELLEMRTVTPSAESAVRRTIDSGLPLTDDDPHVAPILPARMIGQRLRIGLRGLAALYRLTDLHRPFTPDGDVLQRAARDLLREFVAMYEGGLATDPFVLARGRFARQLDWLFPQTTRRKPRHVPPPADTEPRTVPRATLARLQGGIVRSYNYVTHGLVVMVAFRDAGTACTFFEWARRHVTNGAAECDASAGSPGQPGTLYCNVAVTVAGLRMSGLTEDEIDLFPEEFRQGMAARAGLLGDVRNNHPQRWRRPRRFRGIDVDDHEGLDRHGVPLPDGTDVVDLDTVHAIVQFQTRADGTALDADALSDKRHPLRDAFERFAKVDANLEVLAVQSTRRRFVAGGDAAAKDIQEHFGYRDGLGQPEIEPLEGTRNSLNRIHLGEMFHGHPNAADFPLDPLDPSLPDAIRNRLAWLDDGSFLVIRKYRQFVERMEQSIEASVPKVLSPEWRKKAIDIAYAKLMGRDRDGVPLVPGADDKNNFLYSADPQGRVCPLHAHIRLANPRVEVDAPIRPPRIMRRGMSYGPKYVEGGEPANRGLVFMAYNASISEQFEVIQRWLTGGNSTGSSSGQGCPIVGVPDNGLPRFHRFEDGPAAARAQRMQLEGRTMLFDEPEVLTRLEWGLYLFAPSLRVLERLRDTAARAVQRRGQVPVPWQVTKGRAQIAALEAVRRIEGDDAAIAAWKSAIEDPEAIDRLEAAALWAAIRADHGGLLKTPYGTLVADRGLAHDVLIDHGDRYSVQGQLARMGECFGEVYLGMDDGARYREESKPVNAAIVALTGDVPSRKEALFDAVVTSASGVLEGIAQVAEVQGKRVGDSRYEVSVDVREILDEVLADLAEHWFGLQDGPEPPLFRRGSVDWAWQDGEAPLYPGHFTALSRYIFQPNPGPTPRELARAYGRALTKAMDAFVAFHKDRASLPNGPHGSAAPVARAVFEHPTRGNDREYVSKTIVGVLMGLNPTLIGAVLNIVRELQRDGRFDALRGALRGDASYEWAHRVLDDALRDAARMRPMPQTNWRTARVRHRLRGADGASVRIEPGDVLVVATVSATHQSLEDDVDDGYLMFGGDRSASPHPLHACPGRGAGWEVIVATVAAILARRETMRQGVGPLAFVLEGAIRSEPAAAANAGLRPSDSAPPMPPRGPLPGRGGLVIGWGDSWLDYSFLGTELIVDLRDWLEGFGYRIPRDFCQWTTWTKIETMAAKTGPFCRFLALQIQNAPSAHPPLAVLLSGGGNDSTGDTLQALLMPCAPDGAPPMKPFDEKKLKEHIDTLRRHYRVVIRAVRATLATENSALPILVHGYDHPFPAGKEFTGWLYEPFKNRGYALDAGGAPRDAANAAMRHLVDEFNDMLEKLASTSGGAVRYVKLTGTIAQTWGPNEAAAGWQNDLHPVSAAFGYLAQKLDGVLDEYAQKSRNPPVPTAGVPG